MAVVRRHVVTSERWGTTSIEKKVKETAEIDEVWSREREAGQKLLFPYKVPLSRTILLEWLRKTPKELSGYWCAVRPVPAPCGHSLARSALGQLQQKPLSVRSRSEIVTSSLLSTSRVASPFYTLPCRQLCLVSPLRIPQREADLNRSFIPRRRRCSLFLAFFCPSRSPALRSPSSSSLWRSWDGVRGRQLVAICAADIASGAGVTAAVRTRNGTTLCQMMPFI